MGLSSQQGPYMLGTACTTLTLLQTVCVTAVVLACYVAAKTVMGGRRLTQSGHVTVVVVGAGPCGLTAALIAARCRQVTRIVVWEQSDVNVLISKSSWLTLSERAVQFLRSFVDVDLTRSRDALKDSVGGVVIRSGKLTECLLAALQKCHPPRSQSSAARVYADNDSKGMTQDTFVELRLASKFSRECLSELEAISERIVAVVCDGRCGRAASLLGLNDDSIHHSCRAYGAVATLYQLASASRSAAATGPKSVETPDPGRLTDDRGAATSPPMRSVHKAAVDWTLIASSSARPGPPAHRCSVGHVQAPVTQSEDPLLATAGFHFKLFGGGGGDAANVSRCMALAVARSDLRILKTLKANIDQSVMRSVFQTLYNKYKNSSDQPITDDDSTHSVNFSPRLFEIKLTERFENVTFIEDANVFVVAEGSAARRINFNAGVEMNVALLGLESLAQFIEQAASADSEHSILDTLNAKFLHSRRLTQQLVNNVIQYAMYVS